ncbi:MAG: GAF domain-containing protein, partial [Actinomycetota bacterium]|nr:GAF domain-containing protein [Actinomycetota bacterium]
MVIAHRRPPTTSGGGQEIGPTNASGSDAGVSTAAGAHSPALERYQILDSAAEPVFDELVAVLAQRMGTPHAELTVVTPGRVWLMAATADQGTSRTPQEAMCAEVAADRSTTVIPDTKTSARFAHHPSVDGPHHVRYYAGVPLISEDGEAIGVLCVWDVTPKQPTADEIATLEEFGLRAMALLELRRSRLQLESRDALLAAHTAILELIVEGAALPLILDTLARAVEASIPSTVCSILLLEGGVLHHGAWPNLPLAYRDAIDGLRIGPNVGSCGTAAYTRETVVVEDIVTDPRWTDYRELALAAGLRACWSVPIIGRTDEVLGTFALYYRTARSPRGDELRQLSRWMNLAEVAISRAGDVAALR